MLVLAYLKSTALVIAGIFGIMVPIVCGFLAWIESDSILIALFVFALTANIMDIASELYEKISHEKYLEAKHQRSEE